MGFRYKNLKWLMPASIALTIICVIVGIILYFVLPIITLRDSGMSVDLNFHDLIEVGQSTGSILTGSAIAPFFACLLLAPAPLLYICFSLLQEEGKGWARRIAAYAIPSLIFAFVTGAVLIGVYIPQYWGSGFICCFVFFLVGPLSVVAAYFLNRAFLPVPAAPQPAPTASKPQAQPNAQAEKEKQIAILKKQHEEGAISDEMYQMYMKILNK